MSLLQQFKLFADYNRLMNRRILEAAGKLSAQELKSDRGAFFRSVLGTLNHILVGDIIWLKRFQAHPAHEKALQYLGSLDLPESLDTVLFDDLGALAAERERIDETIVDWIEGLSGNDIEGYLSYRNMAGKPRSKPVAGLIRHLFLHQVNHRSQATTLISQSGVDFGETDILEIIDDHPG